MPEPKNLRAAIVQDADSSDVLMLGWMDDEALALTVETGVVYFFSRSRQRLWQKGETSGNRLHVVSVQHDCDDDALLVRARRDGPVCHTGSVSCFAPSLWQTILQRAADRPVGSYTASLLEAGIERVAQKVGEEAVEVALAAVSRNRTRTTEEVADLWYHCLVLLVASGIDVAEVERELESRHRPEAGAPLPSS